jgi:beta-galactosidase
MISKHWITEGGPLIYRGYFAANGEEDTFLITTQGDNAYGHSVYLESTLIGSWSGSPASAFHNQTFLLLRLQAGSPHIFTVVIDHMGLDMTFFVDSDQMKTPRGIMAYTLGGHSDQSAISWKVTGTSGVNIIRT